MIELLAVALIGSGFILSPRCPVIELMTAGHRERSSWRRNLLEDINWVITHVVATWQIATLSDCDCYDNLVSEECKWADTAGVIMNSQLSRFQASENSRALISVTWKMKHVCFFGGTINHYLGFGVQSANCFIFYPLTVYKDRQPSLMPHTERLYAILLVSGSN